MNPKRVFAWNLASLLLLASSQAGAQMIAPPPPMDPNTPGSPGEPVGAPPGASATIAQLDEAERQDSGRNFELFWANGEVGGSCINMTQLSSNTLGLEKAKSGGPMIGLGAGVRFVALVVGARVRYNALSAFNMWQLNLEGGFKIPISKVDFGILAHGGYSFVGRLDNATLAMNTAAPTNADAVKIRGFNAGLDLVFDYYITPTFSVGAGGFADFLFLNRPPLNKPAGLSTDAQAALDNDSLYAKSGTSAGLQLGAALRLGVHFGL